MDPLGVKPLPVSVKVVTPSVPVVGEMAMCGLTCGFTVSVTVVSWVRLPLTARNVRVKVPVAVLPLVGEMAMCGLTCGFTVSVTVVSWVRLPLTARNVRVKVPVAVLPLVAMVNIEVAVPLAGGVAEDGDQFVPLPT